MRSSSRPKEQCSTRSNVLLEDQPLITHERHSMRLHDLARL